MLELGWWVGTTPNKESLKADHMHTAFSFSRKVWMASPIWPLLTPGQVFSLSFLGISKIVHLQLQILEDEMAA